MNKENLANKLELAAKIIRTNHPWEWKSTRNGWIKGSGGYSSPESALFADYEIRPILAPPPDGSDLHNPDNLSAEQVEIGYRLLSKKEFKNDKHMHHYEWWSIRDKTWHIEQNRTTRCPAHNFGMTYRVPLNTPWFTEEDKFADLKKAFLEGKTIQYNIGSLIRPDWQNCPNPQWNADCAYYRIKPWTLPEPPAGKKWHREDGWTEDMLEGGYRPLLDDEVYEDGDEGSCNDEAPIGFAPIFLCIGEHPTNLGWARTKRPIPAPKIVPLEQSDITAGARLIFLNDDSRYSINYDNKEGVSVDGIFWTFGKLMKEGAQILHANSSEPKPCHKEKT